MVLSLTNDLKIAYLDMLSMAFTCAKYDSYVY